MTLRLTREEGEWLCQVLLLRRSLDTTAMTGMMPEEGLYREYRGDWEVATGLLDKVAEALKKRRQRV